MSPLTVEQELAIDRQLAANTRVEWKKTCTKCKTSWDRAAYLALPPPKGGEFQADEYGERVGLILRQCLCNGTMACPQMRDGRLLP